MGAENAALLINPSQGPKTKGFTLFDAIDVTGGGSVKVTIGVNDVGYTVFSVPGLERVATHRYQSMKSWTFTQGESFQVTLGDSSAVLKYDTALSRQVCLAMKHFADKIVKRKGDKSSKVAMSRTQSARVMMTNDSAGDDDSADEEPVEDATFASGVGAFDLYDVRVKSRTLPGGTKVPKECALGVNTMGITLFDKSDTSRPLHTFIFHTLLSWSAHPGHDFAIVLREKEKEVVFETPKGEEICLVMEKYAKQLVEHAMQQKRAAAAANGGSSSPPPPAAAPPQTRTKASRTASNRLIISNAETSGKVQHMGTLAAVKEASEDATEDGSIQDTKLMGKYVVIQRALYRETAESDSRELAHLDPGDIVDVVEAKIIEKGVVRVRFNKGWASIFSESGKQLMVKLAD